MSIDSLGFQRRLTGAPKHWHAGGVDGPMGAWAVVFVLLAVVTGSAALSSAAWLRHPLVDALFLVTAGCAVVLCCRLAFVRMRRAYAEAAGEDPEGTDDERPR